ncbi:MAG: response regulator [Acidobacteria bacterium]|nr:response regulator [Acidobacteriota bacterium]
MPRLVLVADGSPSHQRRAQGILTGEGLEVITVSNGVAAIKKLPTVRASLVLADVSMPGRDGYEVCDFVKNSPELAKIPVLLSYSDQTPYDESRAQRARADGRIKKPFGQDELLSTVNRFIPKEEAPPPPPTVRAPIAAGPVQPEAPEPMDLPAEISPKVDMPDLGALAGSPAFADQPLTEEYPEVSPPPMSIEEAFSSASGETAEAERSGMPFGGFPESESQRIAEPVPAPEPMLVEESAEAAPEEEEEPAARTMMFRMPVQLAEPILADDSSAAPPVEEPPPVPPVPPAPAPGEASSEIAASTMDSYSLADAATGQVSIPSPLPEAPAAMTMEEPPPAAADLTAEAPPAPEPVAATSAAAVLDTDLVHWIVHSVVVRMAPPALSTAQVEELIHQITDEMINDLTQPPPET